MTEGHAPALAERRSSPKVLPAILLLAFVTAITLADQVWVGGLTIYSDATAPRREMIHEAILHNRVPPEAGSWRAMGGNGINVRVLTVWMVEGLHRLSGVSVEKTYRLVETVALFLFLLAVYFYLRHWFDPGLTALGLAYVAAVLPLTYMFHNFHPWDKPSWLAWVLLLMLLRSGRIAAFAVLLVVSIVTKYDTVLLPGLYFLATVSRERILRVSLITAGLFAVSFGIYFALRMLIPGGFETTSPLTFAKSNLADFAMWTVRYPPVLALGVPVFLAAVGWRSADRFARSCVIFGAALLPVFFLQSNFVEVRALMPVLVLLLPSALGSAARAMGSAPSAEAQVP